MKWLLRFAVRLYPRAWRDRYGEEFVALINDLSPRWRHVINIVVGALIMQISRLALVPVALAMAGAVAGAAVSLAMPPVYASSSWVLVQGDSGPRIRTAIDTVLQHTEFDKKAIAVTLRGEPGRDPVLLQVSASADSAQAAQQATNNALGRIIEANVVTAHSERTPGVQFRALQPADLPATAQRDTVRNSAVGGGLGLLVGAAVLFVAHRRRVTP
jgi:uncharacterized protein involved in exopolysaccharide biosynthesis